MGRTENYFQLKSKGLKFMFPLLSSPGGDIHCIDTDTLGSERGVINKYPRTISTSQACPGHTTYDHLNRGGRGWLVARAARYGDDPGGLGLGKKLRKMGWGAERGPGERGRIWERAEKCWGVSGLTHQNGGGWKQFWERVSFPGLTDEREMEFLRSSSDTSQAGRGGAMKREQLWQGAQVLSGAN